MSAIYQLRTSQKIPATKQVVWDFISSPRNLKKITPKYMGFEITNEPIAEKVFAGMIIAYKVKPILGINMNWVTEITQVKELEYFVDNQIIGPYSVWHHLHQIKEIDGGVIMEDIVSYKPPMGFIGDIANSILIKEQLKTIFDYRFEAVEREFGKWQN